MTTKATKRAPAKKAAAAPETLTVTDNRTGKTYELPIADGTIKATDLRNIKVNEDDFGMMTYDPAFMNTASCRSAVTYIDGDVGILRYRGYPIEQLAEKSDFVEVSYLLNYGELPTKKQLDEWNQWIFRPRVRRREHPPRHQRVPTRRPPHGGPSGRDRRSSRPSTRTRRSWATPRTA